MYSKNKLLYKTGLKRAWVSWAKSENGRENAMVRHNLYNLAAYLCQEFWVVFLPLPPLSPPLPPPHPLPWNYFSIKDRLVHVAEVINPFYLRESFDDTLTSVICCTFMTSRGSITHDSMCDRQLNTVKSGILFRASAGKYLLIGLAANCKRKPAKHRWRQLRQTEQGSNRPRLKNRLARLSGRRPFATPSKLLRGINLLWKTASFRKNKEEA